ncbi:MAG: hypothetical protein NDI69_13820 [Bacteriovoracaceae bacterium]|nr:hypothetical protein [Bacteriovoracaceae bacterium]
MIWTATFKGISVKVISSGRGVHDEIFRPFPLSTNISVILHKRLEEKWLKGKLGAIESISILLAYGVNELLEKRFKIMGPVINVTHERHWRLILKFKMSDCR